MYSYALFKTKDALGRSFILKEFVDFQTPSLSWYLLCKDTVLYSTNSLLFLFVPWFFHTVAFITPVLNLFSGVLPSIFSIYFTSFLFGFYFRPPFIMSCEAPGSEAKHLFSKRFKDDKACLAYISHARMSSAPKTEFLGFRACKSKILRNLDVQCYSKIYFPSYRLIIR